MAKIAQQGYRVLQSTDFIDEVTLDGLPKAEVASDGSLRVPTIKAADYQRLLARLTPEAQGPQVAKPVAPGGRGLHFTGDTHWRGWICVNRYCRIGLWN